MMLSLSSTDIQLPTPQPVGLAKYHDLTEMARGGNGVLYSAYDQIVGRTVVLKMLLPEHRLDRGFRRRLLREARVTAQLEHPGTVPVHEIGEDEEYGIYYAMKRISGENFFAVLRQLAKGDENVADAFPLHRRIEIIRDTCQTLDFAHASGVIHRDVKPENIWVGNFGEVTLLDWGSAKVWGEPAFGDGRYPVSTVRRREPADASLTVKHEEQSYEVPPLTPVDQLVGTPTYMSPEQISNRDIDERSDVFSAGVCLYEAMAIAEPFRGRDRDETFDNICMRQPTPPSERSPKQRIPPEADRIVFKAIAKQKDRRYQSMRELIAELDELLLIVRQEETE
ncbi:serine/threonine protein kinase [Aporhodopirellula aestuarii]|uniref:Serine/threonine protein kinase n=1 Tax=Aporhodopirellula aestuarii TaxID=2950107 RepID=A0ABT0U6W1_9BACT|nr:serine/threonine-protein kinase [Aporhodopirellula aestuarii]MCM2372143.1 serine/threonine protein kinase [Aporhodopirellula aestuarii]